MDYEWHAATGARERARRLPAEDGRGKPAAIQEDQCLLAALDTLAERLGQGPAQDRLWALGRILLSHVHHRDAGERPIEDAALEDDALVSTHHRVAVGLHGRRGGTEDDDRVRTLCANDGDVPSVVPRVLLLLVRGIVLLVDDHEPYAVERCEDGRPRTDDDVDVALPDPLPLVVALPVRETAVLNGNAPPEPAPEGVGHCRRQRDLRDEHE